MTPSETAPLNSPAVSPGKEPWPIPTSGPEGSGHEIIRRAVHVESVAGPPCAIASDQEPRRRPRVPPRVRAAPGAELERSPLEEPPRGAPRGAAPGSCSWGSSSWATSGLACWEVRDALEARDRGLGHLAVCESAAAAGAGGRGRATAS